jgi:hypothetical protein
VNTETNRDKGQMRKDSEDGDRDKHKYTSTTENKMVLNR